MLLQTPLFNADMDRRLFDLNDALSGGGAVVAIYHPGFEHSNTQQPPRVWVDISDSGRRLVFSPDMAGSLADQLAINGHEDAAGLIRAALPAN